VKPIAWVLKDAAGGGGDHGGVGGDADQQSLLPSLNAGGMGESDDGGLVGENPPTRLQKKLGVWDLVFYGVGSTVGAGIYSLIGPGLVVAGEW
jgi:hypothetical protein